MIIVTGEKGQLSVSIKDYLLELGFLDAMCLSVRGLKWETFDFENVDTIVHVAGVVPKPGVTTDDFYSVNRDLTGRLARRAKEKGVKRFIYISSMAVYGTSASLDPKVGRIDSKTPCRPTSDYGESKLEAEKLLLQLESDNFKVTIIRVPSIYSFDKREYFEQYELICRKFRCIPMAFRNCYRSAISVNNLCEFIHIVIVNNVDGVLCPDNGPMSASDYCAIIHPEMKRSRLIGFCIEKFMRWHPMVKLLFGALYYDSSLSDTFGGSYRVNL